MLYERALETLLSCKEERPGDEAAYYNNFGLLYSDLKELGKAEEYLRKALSMRGHVYGSGSREYAETQVNLASVLSLKGSMEEAEELFESGINTLSYQVGLHPELEQALSTYLDYLKKSGQNDKIDDIESEIEFVKRHENG